jgi:hypothetical protein
MATTTMSHDYGYARECRVIREQDGASAWRLYTQSTTWCSGCNGFHHRERIYAPQ